MPEPLADADKNFVEIVIEGNISAIGGTDQDTVNTLYYRRAVAGVAYSAAALVAAFHTATKTLWKAAASESWQWTKTKVRVMNDSTENWYESVVAEVGGVAGDALNSMICAIIAKKTALRGRKYQGRLKFGGLPISGVEGNELTAAHIILLAALRAALLANVTENGNTWTPYHFVPSESAIGTEQHPAIIVSQQITSMPIRAVLGRCGSRRSKVR